MAAQDVPGKILEEIESHGWWKGDSEYADARAGETCIVIAPVGAVPEDERYAALMAMSAVVKERYPLLAGSQGKLPDDEFYITRLIVFNDNPETTLDMIRDVVTEATIRLADQ